MMPPRQLQITPIEDRLLHRCLSLFTELPITVILGNSVSDKRASRKPSFVLCSASCYTALTGLQRTNSPATRLQQPVAPRNKSSQHTLPYTPVAGRIRPIYASHMPLYGSMEREIATVSFRE